MTKPTQPTTARERERWLKDLKPYLGKQGHGQSEIMARLIADISRLEGERDAFWNKGPQHNVYGYAQYQAAEWGAKDAD